MRWVKIYDSILDWRWHHKPEYVSFMLHCLLKANPKPTKWETIELEKGQFVTSMKSMCETIGISERTYRTIIKNLTDCGFLTIKTTNKYTVVTVCNYATYQATKEDKRQSNDNQKSYDSQSKDNQKTTDIEYKNKRITDFKEKENKETFLKNGGTAEKKVFEISELEKILSAEKIFMTAQGYQEFKNLNESDDRYGYKGGVIRSAKMFLKNPKNAIYGKNAPPAPPPPSDPKAVEVWERVKNRLSGTMYCVAFNQIFNPKTRALNFLNNGEILKIAVPTESVRNEIRAHAAEFYQALKPDNIRDLRFEIINS